MVELIFSIFLLLMLLSVGGSAVSQWWRRVQRLRLIRQLERSRGSRVITLIHRQERLSFLGIPIFRSMDLDDAEKILRAIRWTPPDKPIDLILHTPGGLRLPAQQVAYALRRHPARVTVIVPHYAMSGGTLLALAADQVLMDPNAVLGSSDPQIQRQGGGLPAAAVLSVLRQKPTEQIDDETIMLADVATKGLEEMQELARFLLSRTLSEERAGAVATALTSGRWSHDYPLPVPALEELGLPIGTELPREVYRLMELYPQSQAGPQTVQFVPEKY